MSKADIDELRIVVQADDKDASKTLDALVSKLTALKEASKGFRKNKALESWATKAEEANNSLSAMAKTIDAVSSSIASLNDSMKSFSSGIKGATSDAKGLEKALQSSESMKGTTEAAAKASDAIETATTKARGFSSVFSGIGTVARGVGGFFSRVGQIGATAFGKIQSATHATVSTIKRIGSVVSNTATQFGKISKSALSFATLPFKPVINGVKSIDDRLFGVFKSLLRIAKLRIFRGIIKSITAGLREGIANAYQWANVMGNQFAGSMDRVATSAQYLKNSLGAMAMPIFNALAPVLDALIDKVVTLLNAINQLIAKLTGASGWTKAVKVPKAYASGMADAAGSAEKLKKELITILGIDELNVMEGDNDSGSGGGGGGAGGGFTEMFEESTFSENINNLADMIKKSWANADFTDIGTMIGEKIKGALDGIPWDTKIKPVASKLGKSLATLLNGVIEVEGLGTSIGETIAQAYNTALNFAYDFVHNLHWDSLGEFIGDTINGFTSKVDLEKLRQTARELGTGIGNTINSAFETTDWEGVGNTIAQSMNSVFDFLYNLGSTIKWEDIGADIATAFNTWQNNFDFKQAGATLGTWASGLLELFTTTVQGIEWSTLGSKVGELIAGINWSDLISKAMEGIGSLVGGFAGFAAGLFSDLGRAISDYFSNHTILDALGDIGTWIYNNIISPFMSGLDKGFNNTGGITFSATADVTYDPNTRILPYPLDEYGNYKVPVTIEVKTPTADKVQEAVDAARKGLGVAAQRIYPDDNKMEYMFGNGFGKIGGVSTTRQLLTADLPQIDVQGIIQSAEQGKKYKPTNVGASGVIQNAIQDKGYMPAKIDTQGLIASATPIRGFRAPTIPSIGSVQSASQGTGYRAPTVGAVGSITSAIPVANLNPIVTARWSITEGQPQNVPESVISKWNQNEKKPVGLPESIVVPWNQNEKKPQNVVSSIYTPWNHNGKTPQNVVSSIYTPWNQNNKKPQNVVSDIIVPWNTNNKKPMNVVSDIITQWNTNNKKPINVVSDIITQWNHNNKKPMNVVSDIFALWNQNGKTPQNVPGSIKTAWYRSGDVQNIPGNIKTAWYRLGEVLNLPTYLWSNWKVDQVLNKPRSISASLYITDVSGGGGSIKVAQRAKGGIFDGMRWHSLPQYADGTLNAGSVFVSGEAGPELVGHVRGKTEVLNQSQLAATMSASMTEAQAPQNALLREQNALLRELINAQGNIRATISSGDVVNGLQQKNRRDGRTIVPIGV